MYGPNFERIYCFVDNNDWNVKMIFRNRTKAYVFVREMTESAASHCIVIHRKDQVVMNGVKTLMNGNYKIVARDTVILHYINSC